MSNPAPAIFSPTKKTLRRIRALARCPHIIPGIEPSGTNTEQIKDATASAEKRSGVGCGLLAAAADANTGRAGVWVIGGVGGGATPVTISAKAGCITGTGAAPGIVMVFWQVGQVI